MQGPPGSDIRCAWNRCSQPRYRTRLHLIRVLCSQRLRHTIAACWSLSVLYASGIYPGYDSNFPSFVPNIGGSLGITSRLESSELTFSAATSFPSVGRSSTTSTISLKGAGVDTISRCTDMLSCSAFETQSKRWLLFVRIRFVSWCIHQQDLAITTSEIDDLSVKILQASDPYPPYKDTSLAQVLLRTISLDTLHVSKFVQFQFGKPNWSSLSLCDEGKTVEFNTFSTTPYRKNRHWFQTKQGYFGLGPSWMKPDDLVVIFDGGKTPFVLRNVVFANGEPGDTWQLVGDCFLTGWMHGDYCGHTVVDEMPPHTEDNRDDKKYLVREFFTLV
jgi:hypothetical protein